MKQLRLPILLTVIMSMTVGKAYAYFAKIDGIYYDLPGSVAIVTGISQDTGNSSAYSGDVIIPSTVTYNGKTYRVTAIGYKAFYYCRYMTSISIPNSVTSIGESAFENCTNLSSVEIPTNVKSVDSYAFRYCSGLTNVTIPNSIISIGISIFRGCSQLTKVDIPNSITKISSDMFRECSKLASVCIPNSITTIDSQAFMECGSLKDIEIPNSVTSIGQYAFYRCTRLAFISIPNSVKTISYNVFEGCNNLTSVSIGSGLTSISTDAFKCDNLVSISIEAKTPPTITSSTFSSKSKITLYIPIGCKSAYQTATNWPGFKNIMEVDMSLEQCAMPTITYISGKLHFDCETDDVTYYYSITSNASTIQTGNDKDVSTTYIVKVYASKEGYSNSEVATKEINLAGLKGDTNGDGEVTPQDASLILQYLAKKITW